MRLHPFVWAACSSPYVKAKPIFKKHQRLYTYICVFYFSTLTVFPVSATTWVKLHNPNKTVQYAYDKDRLRTEGQYVTFWRRVQFNAPQPSKFGKVSQAIYQERIDCQNQTIQTLFTGLYDSEHHSLLEQSVPPENTPAVIILPESIGDLLQAAVCTYATFSPTGSAPTHGKSSSPSTFIPKYRPVIIDTLPSSPITSFPPLEPSTTATPSSPSNSITPVVPPLLSPPSGSQ